MKSSRVSLLESSSSSLPTSPERIPHDLSMNPRTTTILVTTIWLGLVSAAMALLVNYSHTPGQAHSAPVLWPAASRVALDPARPTLVLLAHPHCPCTRATLGELEILMAEKQGRLSARVVFIRPNEFTEDWVKSDLWRSASSIPGVTVSVDDAGTEARLFHAETSGQTLLFDRSGALMIFEGGITESRGHAGDNAGRSAITALLTSPSSSSSLRVVSADLRARTRTKDEDDYDRRRTPIVTPVFGCPLFVANCAAGETKCKK